VALAGSQATQQCLRAGLLDDIQVALVALLLGGGVRLFATSADRSAWKSSACSMLQA
jgi:dihydrofolate reductase